MGQLIKMKLARLSGLNEHTLVEQASELSERDTIWGVQIGAGAVCTRTIIVAHAI